MKGKAVRPVLMFFFSFFLLEVHSLSGQVILWTRQYDSRTNDMARAVAVDSDLNVYVTGMKFNFTDYDFFTIKYDADGNTIWTQQYNSGNGDEYVSDITVDAVNNIYVLGSKNNGAEHDIFIIKYDPLGNTLWTQQRYNAGGNDFAGGIAVDQNLNFYICGSKDKGGSFWDFLTVKYDMNRNVIWTQQHDCGSSVDMGNNVAVDHDKNVYIVGERGFISDIVTMKYDMNGNSIWTQQYNSGVGGEDWGRGIVVDPADNVYITGGKRLSGPVSLRNILTIKYSLSGSSIWTQEYDGGSGEDLGMDIAIDPNNNLYVAGEVFNGVDKDFILIKYDPDGHLLWTKTYDGGKGDDVANGVAVDKEYNVYVTGQMFNGTNNDYFTIKYQQPPFQPVLSSAVLLSLNSIQLSWQDTPNEDAYIIERSSNKTDFSRIAQVSKNKTSYIDEVPLADMEYYYQIIATNKAGRSIPSLSVKAAVIVPLDTVDGVTFAPNPFRPVKKEDKVAFYNLPDWFELTVYTPAGKEVAHLMASPVNKKFFWDAKNKQGQFLKSGVYLCSFKDKKGHEKYLKLVIIR